jgi:hypothetical protein
VVFDDAVVDDEDAPTAVAVRMGVLKRRFAVSGPACMADARRSPKREVGYGTLEFPDLADRLPALDSVFVEQRHAAGVIAPILQSMQALQEDR